jgi:hypothetical protein
MSISRRAIGQVACDLAIGRGRIPAKSFQVFRRMLVHPPQRNPLVAVMCHGFVSRLRQFIVSWRPDIQGSPPLE